MFRQWMPSKEVNDKLVSMGQNEIRFWMSRSVEEKMFRIRSVRLLKPWNARGKLMMQFSRCRCSRSPIEKRHEEILYLGPEFNLIITDLGDLLDSMSIHLANSSW